jgi:hypothetical protein
MWCILTLNSGLLDSDRNKSSALAGPGVKVDMCLNFLPTHVDLIKGRTSFRRIYKPSQNFKLQEEDTKEGS